MSLWENIILTLLKWIPANLQNIGCLLSNVYKLGKFHLNEGTKINEFFSYSRLIEVFPWDKRIFSIYRGSYNWEFTELDLVWLQQWVMGCTQFFSSWSRDPKNTPMWSIFTYLFLWLKRGRGRRRRRRRREKVWV